MGYEKLSNASLVERVKADFSRAFSSSILVLSILTVPFPAYAEPEEVLARLRRIETKVQGIEARQKEILAQQDKILAELDRLRVWVHRR